ncbi:peptide-methionine (R)-S-oxide reductase MsrB [Zobellia laminariae]|uniref:peptide-methionine (R)-S-oxide reductase MsrB n=1 Tax=Zobellia laminariae TaxID=248906 RepID=UPI0012D98365|nr:peptide-methionine (R)-S-oxide reductase MsrB [Zobellia laminariae]MUH41635.1 peptide-methionine (R)-S-oxide reductase [Zobellia laminariae]WKX77006.1 peptide-methionine (R)-S-oxide reductase MsrB [Zobellia laminariae]
MYKNILIAIAFALVGCQGNSQKKETAQEITEKKETNFSVVKTDAEWQKELTDAEFYVLRKAATENPFTSDILENKKEGTYVCAACGTELFKSSTKFDSGTGWPSFYEEIKGNVGYDVDYKIGYKRTEEHCATCGGHLGHVFEDGPEPTGLRHCINGVALDFVPAE